MRIDSTGKQALSRVTVQHSSKLLSLIQVELVTGRTHQIRVHCQAEGHEIAGDDKYGDPDFNRAMRKREPCLPRLSEHPVGTHQEAAATVHPPERSAPLSPQAPVRRLNSRERADGVGT